MLLLLPLPPPSLVLMIEYRRVWAVISRAEPVGWGRSELSVESRSRCRADRLSEQEALALPTPRVPATAETDAGRTTGARAQSVICK